MNTLNEKALLIGKAGITEKDLFNLEIPKDLHQNYLEECKKVDELLTFEGPTKLRWGKFLTTYTNGTLIPMPYDGNVYEHSLIMTGLAEICFSEEENLSTKEKALLKLAARFHDLGEIKYGDQVYNLKTTDDDEKEKLAIVELLTRKLHLTHIPTLLPELFPIIFAAHIHALSLGFFFHLLEKFGYLNTTIHFAIDQVPNWQYSVSNAFSNQFPFILKNRNLTCIKYFLQLHKESLTILMREHSELWSYENYLCSLEKVYDHNDREQIISIKKNKGRDLIPASFESTLNELQQVLFTQ